MNITIEVLDRELPNTVRERAENLRNAYRQSLVVVIARYGDGYAMAVAVDENLSISAVDLLMDCMRDQPGGGGGNTAIASAHMPARFDTTRAVLQVAQFLNDKTLVRV